MRSLGIAGSGLACCLVIGCGVTIPHDPDGALDRITGTTLRVGASPAQGLVRVDGAHVTGPLPDLVDEFAATRDADIEFTVLGEEEIVDALEAGRIDLGIGPMTDESPWTERASQTRGYDTVPGADGRKVVLLLPLGENRFQSALETFLDAEVGP
ncbi:hypothetical protein [Tessaracoccus palaemonis]|uniref:Solute-binding protein family 3/N-terminal domain-containing protein n=1 Tax=Tessaracoccus palaemonis TaxID=2829499 RepID=A0ABX8SG19_9ACTN|nr:hypothetical protein [Tessaracoccus palaemonis]QXT62301.1 hypothetical protein KDB89_11145 [Tessaracoccus palaemonis]